MAIAELPQRPVLMLSGDFYQLGPMRGQRAIVGWLLQDFRHFILTEGFRSRDPILREFLATLRNQQPTRLALEDFFASRRLSSDLDEAVRQSMAIAIQQSKHFVWLTVTNRGAESINAAAIGAIGITPELLASPGVLHGDPKVHAGPVYPKVGAMIRLTRNLDKDRGFVNGAIGEVVDVLSLRVFTVKLSSGCMVLVHPIVEEWKDEDGLMCQRSFLPCSYGYATTIRRAQGSTMDLGALYFDHRYPPDFGYGYVAASRFRTAAGIYLYGRIRRTDFLPVLAKRQDQQENFQYRRSALSEPDDDDTMSAADTKSLDRLAAIHEQAADNAFEAVGMDLIDLSDASSRDSEEEQLEEPAMSPEPLEGLAIQEADADAGTDADDELFDLADCC